MAEMTATKAPRQQFTWRDDMLLFERMERMAPWSYHGGVMSAWKQVADALNGDPGCTMTGLNATSCRARFYRMVTQRKEGQDKMLRRGVTNESEYELKVAKLDALIVNMDGDLEKAAQLDALYDRLMKDAQSKEALPSLEVSTVPVRPTVAQPRQEAARPQQSAVAGMNEVQPQVQCQPQRAPPQPLAIPVARSSIGVVQASATLSEATRVHPLPPPVNIIPMDLRVPHRNSKRPADAASTAPTATKRAALLQKPDSSTGSSDLSRLISVAERAIELLMRKIEQDQEAATAERQWRREQARAHRETMEAMEQQTNQLKNIALEWQWKGL